MGAPVKNAGWPVGEPLPRGKGVWVYSVRQASGPENLADRLEWLGCSWVLIQTHRIQPNGDRVGMGLDVLEAHVAELRRRGIGVAFWGWPEPSNQPGFVERAVEVCQQHRPVAFVVNAEKPYYPALGGDPDSAGLAHEMMQALRAGMPSETLLGFSSYGRADVHPNFPFAEFALHSDFGIPQIYDIQNRYKQDYPSRAMSSWEELFAGVVPAWSAGESKTPEQMDSIQDRTPLDSPAGCWWDFKSIISSRSRAAAVRGYSVNREAMA